MGASTALIEADEFLSLVADPHRWRILRELGTSDRRVGELCDLTGTAQNLVSYHVRRLREAGLIVGRRSSADARDTYYRVDLTRCRALLMAAGASLHPAVQLAPTPSAAPLARRGRRQQRVLFLCTGNSARSQIAEALLEHRTGGAIVARSAGSNPKPLHPLAVQVLAARGIDIAGRTSKHLDQFTGQRFDAVITLCDKVKEVCPTFPGTPTTAHWSMADPSATAGGDAAVLAAFERTAAEIEERVDALIAQLTQPRTKEERP